MRYVYMDFKAIHFQAGNHGINVFWHDFISGRGKRFFLARLKAGIRLLLKGGIK